MNTITDQRTHEVRLLTGVTALICATACATSVVPGLEDLITRALILGAVLVVLGVLARLAMRWVRERREDRQDRRLADLRRTVARSGAVAS